MNYTFFLMIDINRIRIHNTRFILIFHLTARSISRRIRLDQGHDDRFSGKKTNSRVRVRVHTSSAGLLVSENSFGVSTKYFKLMRNHRFLGSNTPFKILQVQRFY